MTADAAERSGRTTRMVAEAVAATTAHGTVYIVAAHDADARRIASMVADAAMRAGRANVRRVGTEIGWLGGYIRVVTRSYRWLDTRGPKWRIIGSDTPLSVDHHALEVWRGLETP